MPAVPSPCRAATRDPSNTGNTGGTFVGPTATFVETAVPTGDPLGAFSYYSLRSGHDKYTQKDTTSAVSALRPTVISNVQACLIALSPSSNPFSHLHPREWTLAISFVDRVAQIPSGLASQAANTSSVMKSYYVSGYDSLVYSLTAAKSAIVLALDDWNIYMDQIATSEGWGNTLPESIHTPSDIEPIPEIGLVPARQTGLALRQEEGVYTYAGRTALRTALLFGQIAGRKVERWEAARKTTVWFARIGRMAWDGLVIVAAIPMALVTVLALLGSTWVLMWGWRIFRWWWRTAAWLWRHIQ